MKTKSKLSPQQKSWVTRRKMAAQAERAKAARRNKRKAAMAARVAVAPVS